MESGPKFNHQPILPRGYTIDELKNMSPDELAKACEVDNLDSEQVLRLLGVSQVIKNEKSNFEVTPVHHDQLFLNRLETRLEYLEPKIVKINLEDVPRAVFDSEKLEEDTFKMIEEYQSIEWDAPDKEKVRREELKIKTIENFKQIFLQKGLALYDKLVAKRIPELGVRMEVVDMLLSELSTGENVYEKRLGLDRALQYFGYDSGSQRELLAELAGVIKRVNDRSANVSEQIQLNKLIRAAKGVYSVGETTVNAGFFSPLLRTIAEQYKISRPKNTMSAGAIQGSEIYEAGAYADNAYSKGHRPRRYGDGLGRN